MDIDFVKLAEPKQGERPYKGYIVRLEKGYVRVMASRIDREGMVVSVNYYGRLDASGRPVELTRVSDKRQDESSFLRELESFRASLHKAGMEMELTEL